MADYSDAPWDGAASNYSSTADFCHACLINDNTGPSSGWVQSKCHLPVKEPGGAVNKNALRNAAARINQVQSAGKAAAAKKLESLLRQAKIGKYADSKKKAG
jgi:hypothetical protein